MPYADLLFINAQVVTVDRSDTVAEALAVKRDFAVALR
jgi:predicted amidohydrolase YtcJ